MPARVLNVDGRAWQVYPSGFLTQYVADEFGLIFVSGQGDTRDVRVTRYSPGATRSREQSLAELDAVALLNLFRMSQPSARSPEAGYHAGKSA
ncbi:MAG: hypothetical protein ABI852_18240 [Gemmatimonadaceae bacterium]